METTMFNGGRARVMLVEEEITLEKPSPKSAHRLMRQDALEPSSSPPLVTHGRLIIRAPANLNETKRNTTSEATQTILKPDVDQIVQTARNLLSEVFSAAVKQIHHEQNLKRIAPQSDKTGLGCTSGQKKSSIVRKRVDFSIQTEKEDDVEESPVNLNELNRLKSLQVINKKVAEDEVDEILFEANSDSDESGRDTEPEREFESNQDNKVSNSELTQNQVQSKYVPTQSENKEGTSKEAESKRNVNLDSDKIESNEELKQRGDKPRRDNEDAENVMSELWLEEFDYLIEVYRKQEEIEMDEVGKYCSSRPKSETGEIETELERLHKEWENTTFEWYQDHQGATNKRDTKDGNGLDNEQEDLVNQCWRQNSVKENTEADEACEDKEEKKGVATTKSENDQNCQQQTEKVFVAIDNEVRESTDHTKQFLNNDEERHFQDIDNENSTDSKERVEMNEDEDSDSSDEVNADEEEIEEDDEEEEDEEEEEEEEEEEDPRMMLSILNTKDSFNMSWWMTMVSEGLIDPEEEFEKSLETYFKIVTLAKRCVSRTFPKAIMILKRRAAVDETIYPDDVPVPTFASMVAHQVIETKEALETSAVAHSLIETNNHGISNLAHKVASHDNPDQSAKSTEVPNTKEELQQNSCLAEQPLLAKCSMKVELTEESPNKKEGIEVEEWLVIDSIPTSAVKIEDTPAEEDRDTPGDTNVKDANPFFASMAAHQVIQSGMNEKTSAVAHSVQENTDSQFSTLAHKVIELTGMDGDNWKKREHCSDLDETVGAQANHFQEERSPSPSTDDFRLSIITIENTPQRSDEICSLKDQRVKSKDLEEGSGSKRDSISFEHPSLPPHGLSNSDRSAIRFPAQQTQDVTDEASPKLHQQNKVNKNGEQSENLKKANVKRVLLKFSNTFVENTFKPHNKSDFITPMTPPSTPFVMTPKARAGLFEAEKEEASSDQADDEDEDWKARPKHRQFQQEAPRTGAQSGHKEKRLSSNSILENKIKMNYMEENTRRLEVESMVQFEARMENGQKEEDGKAKSASSSLKGRDLRAWDETGEYFLILLLAVVILYLVNDLLHKFLSPPSSSCLVDSSTEEETLVPALCQLEGYANQNCFMRL